MRRRYSGVVLAELAQEGGVLERRLPELAIAACGGVLDLFGLRVEVTRSLRTSIWIGSVRPLRKRSKAATKAACSSLLRSSKLAPRALSRRQ